MTDAIFFEDVVPGKKLESGPYHVAREEMLEYSRKWNPLPFHTDEAAARASIYGGLTAPSTYILAVRTVLLDRLPLTEAMSGTILWDDVRFLIPVRPEDDLRLEVELIEKRLSRSKPDRGIVKTRVTLFNQRGEAVMSQFDTIMLRLRNPASAGA